MDRGFQAIAQKHNTTVEEVMHGIDFAVDYSQRNAPHMWKDYHGTTARDAVDYLAKKVLHSIAH